jgi:hypothetical protein
MWATSGIGRAVEVVHDEDCATAEVERVQGRKQKFTFFGRMQAIVGTNATDFDVGRRSEHFDPATCQAVVVRGHAVCHSKEPRPNESRAVVVGDARVDSQEYVVHETLAIRLMDAETA